MRARKSLNEVVGLANQVIASKPEHERDSAMRAAYLFRTSMAMYDHDVSYALAADNGLTASVGSQPSRKISKLKLPKAGEEPNSLPSNGLMKYLQGSGFTGLEIAYYHTRTIHAPSDSYRQSSVTNQISTEKNGHVFQEAGPKEYAFRVLPEMGSGHRTLSESGVPSQGSGSKSVESSVDAQQAVEESRQQVVRPSAPIFRTGAANSAQGMQRARQSVF